MPKKVKEDIDIEDIEMDFGNDDIEENVERVGGFSADESDIYIKAITEAYLTQSAKGAYALNLVTKNKEGDERSYVIYFTNRKGQTFYIKNKKKYQLPGYALINAICKLTCNKTAKEILAKAKMKTIDLMDWESRKEVPTNVKTYPAICKKSIKFGIVKKIDNKYTKGKPTNEPRETNEIKMVFDGKSNLTITELAAGFTDKEDAKLYAQWLKTWQGKDDNQFVEQESDEDESTEGDDPFGADDDADDSETTADASDDEDEDEAKSSTKTKSKSKSKSKAVEEDEDEDDDDPFA